MESLYKDLHKIGEIECQPHAALAPYTSFKIGGASSMLIRPTSISALEQAMEILERLSIRYNVLGKGTNLLVDDAGIGPVIAINSLNASPEIVKQTNGSFYMVQVGAGVKLQALLAWAINNSLSGLEDFAGIPASVGGAIFMNAGANDKSMKDVLSSVLLTGPGGSRWVDVKDLNLSYRSSDLPENSIISAARLLLKKEAAPKSIEKIRTIMKKRRISQPLNKANAGCIFKNPGNTSAGAIIDLCGLKGLTRGDAQISPIHANFIVNLGRATSLQVLDLMELIREKVKAETGIELKPEIQIWTEKA